MADKPHITKNLVAQYTETTYLNAFFGIMLYYLSGLFRLPKSARIVDCACGIGVFIKLLQNRGFREIDGFDAAPEMVALARARTGREIRLLEARDIAKEFPHGTYDAVCVLNMLHHLEADQDFRGFLRGCGDLLKPGGLIVIREPHPTMLTRVFVAMSRYPIFYVGIMRHRLNSYVIERDLFKLFYERWLGRHREVLADAGFAQRRAFNWLDSRIVIGVKKSEA